MSTTNRVMAVLVLGALLVSMVTMAAVLAPNHERVAAADSNTTEQLNQLWRSGEGPGLFGLLNYSGGEATGKYVAFNYSQRDGAVTDLRMNTSGGMVAVVDSMTLSGLGNTAPNVTGPLFDVRGDTMRLIIHNNPTGLVQIGGSSGDSVRLTFADGASVERSNDTQVPSYNISVDGVRMWMATVNADVSVDGEQVDVSFTDSGVLLMRQIPQIESVGDRDEERIVAAINEGLITTEVWALARSNGYVREVAVLSGVAVNVTAVEPGKVTMQTGGDLQGGAVILVNLDRETIDPDKSLQVTLNGEAVSETGLTNVLEDTRTGDPDPAYAKLEGKNTTKFLVYVPDLSTQNTVEITAS